MKNYIKYIPLFFLSIALIFCLGAIFNLTMKRELKSKAVVNEIVKMDVKQVKIDTIDFMNEIHYEYFVGNKYRIVVSHTNAVPYQSSAEDEVFIKDVNGNCVFSYYTRWHHSMSNAWKSDYEKLMKYLKLK